MENILINSQTAQTVLSIAFIGGMTAAHKSIYRGLPGPSFTDVFLLTHTTDKVFYTELDCIGNISRTALSPVRKTTQIMYWHVLL